MIPTLGGLAFFDRFFLKQGTVPFFQDHLLPAEVDHDLDDGHQWYCQKPTRKPTDGSAGKYGEHHPEWVHAYAFAHNFGNQYVTFQLLDRQEQQGYDHGASRADDKVRQHDRGSCAQEGTDKRDDFGKGNPDDDDEDIGAGATIKGDDAAKDPHDGGDQ